ncbi:MAG: carbohydrate-binding protein [Oscillospiraceae bacterium]|nr:carbohydrate-binding protein [Oscillospiraceae bacterium]
MKLKRLFSGIICAALMLCLAVLPPFSTVISADADVADVIDPLSGVLSDGTMRRPLGPDSPMYIVHVDTWVTPDPEAVIALIPEEIRPYVVFNISLSVSCDEVAQKFLVVQYGYETAKSWLRVLAENNCWAMIQPASGGLCHFPDYGTDVDLENTLYGEFFREYPNFLGFNYCEQFWGFDGTQFPFAPSAQDRYRHFANLLELTNKYGGYLTVSWCANQWSPGISPIAMLKEIPEWEEACLNYSENFILCEKYTQLSYIRDTESLVFGIWLSGYCGNFGIRYDETGWTGGTSDDYTMSTGLPIYFERMVLNGATVIDGPELTPVDCILEGDAAETEDGYITRTWYTTSAFDNVAMDSFKKIVDGTFRIPTREEVIDRTKVILVNDVEVGDIDNKYSTPVDLFKGLYQTENDGGLKDNHDLYKSTGRYPTIPMCHDLSDDLSYDFDLVVYKSKYKQTWTNVNEKVEEFNELFPEEYTGDLYAAHYDNVWVTYNPYKANQTATGLIPLQYNTCESMELTYSRYTTGLVNEYADKITFYLNNYDDNNLLKAREDVIVINGATEEPTVTYTDRGISTLKAKVTSTWENGVFTVTVNHNGPIDIEINCKGSATGRSTDYNEASLVVPAPSNDYYGTLQHEVEYFEYTGIDQIVKNASRAGIDNYTALGYTVVGNSDAKLKETVNILTPGVYTLSLRYTSEADVSGVNVYVNGKKVSMPSMSASLALDEWMTVSSDVKLKEGENVVEIRTKGGAKSPIYLDNFTLTAVSHGSSSAGSGTALYYVIGAAAIVIVAVCAVAIIKSLKKK